MPDFGSATETSVSPLSTRRVAWVLDEDPQFDRLVPQPAHQEARKLSRAGVVVVSPGEWSPGAEAEQAAEGLGLLILQGLLLREIGRGPRCAGELLADGDVIDPIAELDGDDPMLGPARWRALGFSRLAILDAHWLSRMAQYPEVLAEVGRRNLNRARRSAARMAMATEPRLDRRVLILLWELAYRFGTVRADGVHVDVCVTHETLAHLVFARRPSVSTAVSRLRSQGLLWRDRNGWVLRHGSAPIDAG